MPTINGILANTLTGLRAQQTALNVVSHNIANAATEGYSRQRAVISPNTPLHTPDGVFGTGVSVTDVEQVRDSFLDATFRLENGSASEHRTRSEMLSRVESVLNEPTEFGIAATLDQFLDAWSDLATNPNSTAHRTALRQRATQLVDKFRESAGYLGSIQEDVEGRLQAGVERANALTTEVARLNKEIVAVEGSGHTTGDLRDARGLALDELSSLLPVKVVERDDGSVGVTSSGLSLVDGAYSMPLEVGSSAGAVGLKIVGRAGLLPDTGGSLGALADVLNTDLPAARQGLDDLVDALVTDINALHQTGTDPDGNTGLDFFDATGSTAWTMALSADVTASVRAIAAGTADGSGGYRAGANDVALGVAGLRDNALGALGVTAGEHMRTLVSSIGLAVRSSTDSAEVHQTLADQADVRRQSLAGVSIDEELVQLIQFQSAYQASARVITATDEMLQSLLAI